VNSAHCPKSVITAESSTLLHQFFTWKGFGGGYLFEMDAKTADAMLILESEWQKEKQNV